MNTLDAIFTRKSTRDYKSDMIPDEALETILKAANAAPVAMAQYEKMHITVVQNESIIKEINNLTSEMMFKKTGMRKNTDFGAKTMVLVSCAPSLLSREMECASVGIIVENMVIAATDLGINSVILGGAPAIISQTEEIMKKLEIPEGFAPVLGAAFGYATEDAPAKDHTISVNRV